ncbi:Replication-associated recombination protein A [Posidoniimonas corsicana]|uniref:Replication-associated recombination protein A n=1 Tax=Posidoniimonas corsicana TaxID=1938618 RepID=A0A5C5UTP7_9BACT|nr:replication-associated recombination protein A [Posidoniimonas corsicana]TWT29239.1 Replication-associated recombination protein A [Posidoniimonas corsicana]
MDLFAASEQSNLDRVAPLAERMRPRSLADVVGQTKLLGEGGPLNRLLKVGRLGSIILYGPPGVGKTTLARLLAKEIGARFQQLSAVTSGVKDLREAIDAARDSVATGGSSTVLFVDEIHRFNKSQQDALLPSVEQGFVALIGATTANPFFAVNSALTSRSRVLQLEPHSPEEILTLVDRALADPDRGLGRYQVELTEDARRQLATLSDGDARRALNLLEVAVKSEARTSGDPTSINGATIIEVNGARGVVYDPTGDEHYDCASALIKSIRGSDPDAGLYWLARMLEGGEDVRFLTRRLVILASEDVGNADPQALPLAVATMQACEFIGLPECQLTLSQCVTYLACAPKSNAATVAIGEARQDVREGEAVPVPRHLRDGHYAGSKRLGHGQGYEYAHNAEDGIAEQDYLGVEREYYRPVGRGFEKELAERLEAIRKKLGRTVSPPPPGED